MSDRLPLAAEVEAVMREAVVALAGAPALNLATLHAVHNYLEFEFEDTLHFDAWLHAHILKAMAAER